MRARDASFGVDDGARTNAPLRALLDERRVRPLARAHEAELLALALRRAGEAPRDGLRADLGLRALAEREHEATELGFGRGEEEVALVLVLVDALAEERAAVVGAAEPRVVPGRDVRRAELVGEDEELSELDAAVACRARARGLAGEVGLDEGRDDGAREELAAVEREVRDAERVGRAPRVVLIFGRAAPTVGFVVGLVRVVPQVQRDADDVVARVDEARGRDAGIDAAAHGDQHACVGLHGARFSTQLAGAPARRAPAVEMRRGGAWKYDAEGRGNPPRQGPTRARFNDFATPSMARAWRRLAHDFDRPSSRAASSNVTSSK